MAMAGERRFRLSPLVPRDFSRDFRRSRGGGGGRSREIWCTGTVRQGAPGRGARVTCPWMSLSLSLSLSPALLLFSCSLFLFPFSCAFFLSRLPLPWLRASPCPCHLSLVSCPLSLVTRHLSTVPYPLSLVTCPLSLILLPCPLSLVTCHITCPLSVSPVPFPLSLSLVPSPVPYPCPHPLSHSLSPSHVLVPYPSSRGFIPIKTNPFHSCHLSPVPCLYPLSLSLIPVPAPVPSLSPRCPSQVGTPRAGHSPGPGSHRSQDKGKSRNPETNPRMDPTIPKGTPES